VVGSKLPADLLNINCTPLVSKAGIPSDYEKFADTREFRDDVFSYTL